MDESGFAVGDSQCSRALINVREESSWKVVSGRTEWITAIECVSAANKAIPPLLIYKAKHTNTAWIPTHTPSNWRFSTSTSGWTSNSHAYEWITTVFEPHTRPEDPSIRRLLIMDGHVSHITANLIAFCMQNTIDLLILPPHTSHVLQPLDISVFAPLKRALAYETDQTSRLDSGRISRIHWTEMYIRARTKAFSSDNIRAGWKSAGLVPLEPMRVLEKLSTRVYARLPSPRTPPQQDQFELSLLESSPPDGTELRQANALLNSTLRTAKDVPERARKYTERMTKAYEATHSELVIARKRLAEQDELLQARKKRTKGKRVALKGKFVFSTEEVLEVARRAEADTAARSAKRSIRKRTIDEIDRIEEEGIVKNESDSSDSDCIVVSSRI
jgi:DDE superfamily endonuclease